MIIAIIIGALLALAIAAGLAYIAFQAHQGDNILTGSEHWRLVAALYTAAVVIALQVAAEVALGAHWV